MSAYLSSGSSGRVRGGAEKHEIYAAAFGGHLFYDLFSQGQGGHGPRPPWIRYCICRTKKYKILSFLSVCPFVTLIGCWGYDIMCFKEKQLSSCSIVYWNFLYKLWSTRRVVFPCNNCTDCLLSTNVRITSRVKVVKREGNKLLLLLLLLNSSWCLAVEVTGTDGNDQFYF